MPYNALNIEYTGPDLDNISVEAGNNLQTILYNIDQAITTSSGPNYSGYDLACITQVDGVSQPTNTQNFAEGISKIVCDNKDDFDTFVATTYDAAIDSLTAAINTLDNPALTYTPFSITSADTITTVFTKMFTGFTGYNTALNPSSASWASLSITAPTTVTNGFNSLITYIGTMNTTIAGKQASLGTFDNSANCLGGGATDTPVQTINYLRTYICTLPEFDASDIDTTCLTGQSDLQDWIQHLVDTTESLVENYVAIAGTGMLLAAGSGCNGKSLSIDPTYTGLRKVGLNSADSTYGYLDTKIKSNTGISIAQVTHSGIEKLEITNTLPYTGKVKVNASDSFDNYLQYKFTSRTSDWGINISTEVGENNATLELVAQIADSNQFVNKVLDTVLNDTSLLIKFKQAMDAADSDLPMANPATALTITII